jgi:hypothetical protein
MLTARDEFSLQRFDRRSVRTPAFDRAIRIYCDTTGGGVKTDASQIVYWAERKDIEFSRTGDQVHVLGLLRDQEVVGFALIFYIPERRLVVADHIAITPSARSMTAFDRFCDLIERYARDEVSYVDYFVAEVSIDINEADPLLNSETLTRLLQIKGFRVADCTYLTPSAETRAPYRPVSAKLLLQTSNETKISAIRLLEIIRSIHVGLYKNWYKPFAQEFDKYCAQLEDIEHNITKQLGNTEYISLDGHPPLRSDVKIEDLPNRRFVVFTYICFAVFLAIASGALLSWLQVGVYSAIGGAVLVGICIIVILAARSGGAAKLVRYAVDAVVRAFDIRK